MLAALFYSKNSPACNSDLTELNIVGNIKH